MWCFNAITRRMQVRDQALGHDSLVCMGLPSSVGRPTKPGASASPCILPPSFLHFIMPLYELFALAKPAVGKAALAEMMRAVGSTVMQQGGVVTDIMSYGQRKLAYDIRQPGSRYSEVGRALA